MARDRFGPPLLRRAERPVAELIGGVEEAVRAAECGLGGSRRATGHRQPELTLQLADPVGKLGGTARGGDVGIGSAAGRKSHRIFRGPRDERQDHTCVGECRQMPRLDVEQPEGTGPRPATGRIVLGEVSFGCGLGLGGSPLGVVGRRRHAHLGDLEEEVAELIGSGRVGSERALETGLDALEVRQRGALEERRATGRKRSVTGHAIEQLAGVAHERE